MADWLAIDIGNSRIKWAAGHAGRWQDVGTCPLGEAADLAAPAAGRRLPAVALNVAGTTGEALLQAWEQALGKSITRITSRASGGGIVNSYERPELLGADRFAALAGARRLSREHCLVVCAGSALTVDWLHADGRHGGGFILPGRHLMGASPRPGLPARRKSAPAPAGRGCAYAP